MPTKAKIVPIWVVLDQNDFCGLNYQFHSKLFLSDQLAWIILFEQVDLQIDFEWLWREFIQIRGFYYKRRLGILL